MHSDDQKLSKALQKHLASSAHRKSAVNSRLIDLHQVPDREATSRVTFILEHRPTTSSTPDDPELVDREVRDAYSFLLSAGYTSSVSTLLQNDPATLSCLGLIDLSLIAISEATIKRWIELRTKMDSKAGGTLAEEMIRIALDDPAKALDSALAAWCCRNIDPNQLKKLSPVVAADQAQGNKQWLLDAAILRDKRGDFLTSWIRDDHNRVTPTAERDRERIGRKSVFPGGS